MSGSPIDITSTSVWLETARLVGIVSIAYVAILWIAMVVWVHRDISERTDDVLAKAVSVAVVAVFFAPGLLVYAALRPRETRAEAWNRQLELEAFAAEVGPATQCPRCRRASAEDFAVCPYCRTSLRMPCDDCGRLLAGEWAGCPYCGAARNAPHQAAPAPPRLVPAPAASGAPPGVAPAGRQPASVPRAAAIQLHR